MLGDGVVDHACSVRALWALASLVDCIACQRGLLLAVAAVQLARQRLVCLDVNLLFLVRLVQVGFGFGELVVVHHVVGHTNVHALIRAQHHCLALLTVSR